MSKRRKAFEKIRNNPKNVRFEDLEAILLDLGFEKIAGKGSHVKFILDEYPPLVVPYKKPFLKPFYIKLVLRTLDELFFLVDEENND